MDPLDNDDGARYVPLVADPLAVYGFVHGVPYVSVTLTAGCECHPELTVMVERNHCMN